MTAITPAETAMAEAEGLVVAAEAEHTAALGALLELERRHDRAFTARGKARLREKIEPAWVRAQKARAEWRDAKLNLALHRWNAALAGADAARTALLDARVAKATPEELVALSEACDAAMDAISVAQREVAMWKPKP